MTQTTASSSRSGRVIFIVLDSVGIGSQPDAHLFGDEGSHTLGHIAQAVPEFAMPNMQRLGLGNIEGFLEMPAVEAPQAAFGRMTERSHGKDTTTGHWEFVGLILEQAFRTFPDGFGPEILSPFIEQTGCGGVLGNSAASGTVIIEELGQEHMASGHPIVYTSADPVFQIAAHEGIVPLETLYKWCKIAYDIVVPHGISRVIARPFVGEPGAFERTSNRKDFAVPPPRETALDALVKAGVTVTSVGKIGDIYAMQGISRSLPTKSNADGMAKTLELIKAGERGLIFTNLVDFDSKYGHRRDPKGYAACLMEFDRWLSSLIEALEPGDLLVLSADHGNDPTWRGTDHTREYVPLLTTLAGATRPNTSLGTRSSFADIGATITDYFGVEWGVGESFLGSLE
jgi:phosphopentomutase